MKMKKNHLFTALIILILTACQEFSVMGAFRLNTSSTEALTLDLERTRLPQWGSMTLTPTGGTPPYKYSVVENDLFYMADWSSIGEFADNTFTAHAAVGRVDIVLQDSAGRSVRKELIIRPPAPSNLSIEPPSGNDIVINWDFSADLEDMMSVFILTRKIEGVTETTEIEITKTQRTYTDSGVAEGNYTYEINTKALTDTSYFNSEKPASASTTI